MNDIPADAPTVPIPPDNPQRQLVIARPESDPQLPHVGIAGDTYTILVTGSDTAGRYTSIDMHVPPDGGPPPHRHDFEEMFTVLEGEVELTFRGQKVTARAGETVNVPANAPHGFRNVSGQPSRLLCVCVPAGQEEFFLSVGSPVGSRTEPPPPLDAAAQAAFRAKAAELAPRYRTDPQPMSTMDDRNGGTIDEFRRNHGQVGGYFAGAPLLLLHTVGARSGLERINPMMYLRDGEHYVVFASKAGADTNPDWYHNLKAHPDVRIEVGDQTLDVHAQEVYGSERDLLFERQAERYPGFAGYQRQTSRIIPVVALTPMTQ